MSDTGGIKHDKEKIQMDLLSPVWLFGVGKVLTFGAKKYAAHNWRKGIQLSRLLGACLRHVLAFLGGEDKDPETGISHLFHASCCLMFASELHETRPELDDRYKIQPVDYSVEEYWCDKCVWQFTAKREAMPDCPECKSSKKVRRFK